MENQLQVIETRTVEFQGDRFMAVKVDENGKHTAFAPIKRLCEVLGVEAAPQRRKIAADAVLARASTIMMLPSEKGPQPTFCLRYDRIPMWLMTINPGKVRPELRTKLEAYREQVADVLADVFLLKGYAVNPSLSDYQRQAALMQAEVELLKQKRLTLQAQAHAEIQKSALGLLVSMKDQIGPSLIFGAVTTFLGIPATMPYLPCARDLSKEWAPDLGFEIPPQTLGKIAKYAGLFAGIDRKKGMAENDYISMSVTVAPKSKRIVWQARYKPSGVERLFEACKVALANRMIEPAGQMHLEGVN